MRRNNSVIGVCNLNFSIQTVIMITAILTILYLLCPKLDHYPVKPESSDYTAFSYTHYQWCNCTIAHISIWKLNERRFMSTNIQTKPMKEILYRESRVAKALGEPAKYAIVNLLFENGPTNVTEIVKAVKRSQSTISHHLAQLKNLEIVRFEIKKDGFYYWLKYPDAVGKILSALKGFVKRSVTGVEHDI